MFLYAYFISDVERYKNMSHEVFVPENVYRQLSLKENPGKRHSYAQINKLTDSDINLYSKMLCGGIDQLELAEEYTINVSSLEINGYEIMTKERAELWEIASEYGTEESDIAYRKHQVLCKDKNLSGTNQKEFVKGLNHVHEPTKIIMDDNDGEITIFPYVVFSPIYPKVPCVNIVDRLLEMKK